MKSIRLLALLISSYAIFSGSATAMNSGWYVGVGAGYGDADLGNDKFVTTPSKIDRHDFGWKATMGYKLNRYFALEGNHIHFSNIDIKGATGSNGTIKTAAWTVNAVGILPIQDKFFAHLKAGVYTSRVRHDNFAFNNNRTLKNNTGFHYGFGGQYDFDANVAVRVEWDQIINSGSNRIKLHNRLVTFSLVYQFS